MREKLIELLESVPHAQRLYPDLYVAHLIANGVTLRQPKPCMLCESDKIHILTITKEPEQLFSFSTEETGLMSCPMCGRDLRGIK